MKNPISNLKRWKFTALSFLLTLVVGVGLSQVPTLRYRLWPAFDRDEVEAKIGSRVRHRPVKEFRAYKCPVNGYCLQVQPGELGTIVGAEPVDHGYFLIVLWDKPSIAEDYVSYIGRYSSHAIE